MTDLELIEQSIEKMLELETEIIAYVYEKFFREHPEGHELFGPNTLGPRTQMVNETIIASLDMLNGEQWVNEYMTSHGTRHRHSYEVTDVMYEQYADCLLDAFENVLGDDFTAAQSAAWKRTLTQLNAIAIAAANGNPVEPA